MLFHFQGLYLCRVDEETANAHLWQIVNRLKIRDRGLLQVNTLRTGDVDLHFYITTVQDG